MRKVVCVHLLNDFSGSARVLAGVVRELSRRGVPVEVLTNRGGRGFLSDAGVPVRTFPYRRGGGLWTTLTAYLLSQAALFAALWRYRREDVTVCVNTLLPFGAAMAARLLGKRVVYYVHETSLRPRLLKRGLRFVAARTASAAVFVSRYLLEEERLPGVPCVLVPNCLPEELEAAARRPGGERPAGEPLNVLMVASPRDYKGVPEFLALAERLAGEPRVRFELVLNGTREEIEAYLRRRPRPANLRVHEGTADVAPFYARAGLVLNLSRPDEWVETFGLTILEAMAFGVPVIVPPVGGPRELVDDGVEGYRIEGRRLDELARVILELAGDPARRRRMSSACRRKAAQFGRSAWADRVVEVLHA
ncbi:MAG TPA: glycosyltransferase family 4 protein [Planctomycetota bacterium]|nr:glycosyltransferase family 4 protein [Planctomycetota bacterium]